MNLTPDETIYWQYGFVKLNETILSTWVLMVILIVGSWLITRNMSARIKIPPWQSGIEIMVLFLSSQIREAGLKPPERYISFLFSLFLFLAASVIFGLIPGYSAPTESLSTTVALASCVFVSVPLYGIRQNGLGGYLKRFAQPVWIMLPFNIISEISRTLALAVRLFGNMVSGRMVVAILLVIAPLIFPILINLLGLVTGMVQAYIFTVLALVYISAAVNE